MASRPEAKPEAKPEKKVRRSSEPSRELSAIDPLRTSSSDYSQDDIARGTWGNRIEFLMSCIAMNVGLGNIWRFPFIAYRNGGGAFLIPYLIVLIFLGRPLYFLEMCLGQFTSRGNAKMFEKLAPCLKGIGYAQMVGSFSVSTYYCSLLSIDLYYLIQSFRTNLPWTHCEERWESSVWLENHTCASAQRTNSETVQSKPGGFLPAPQLYLKIDVLREWDSVDNGIGWPDWRLTLTLLASWIVTYAVTFRGIHSSGKWSYFLALFPYAILLALLIRSVTLEGAGEGIKFFFMPQWRKLYDATVWYSAVTQCFFSLNIGFGCVTMYASYNHFRHNSYRDAAIICTLDTFTSILAGCIIFGILGNLAHNLGVGVDAVIKSDGIGLAFVSYPSAISNFKDVPWLFAILFFSMLFVLGIGSLIAMKGIATGVVKDNYPQYKTWLVTLIVCIIGFGIGLVYTTPGGQYMFTLIDFYGGTAIFIVLAILEIFVIVFWYGLENICLDFEYMLRRKLGIYWRFCWTIFDPIVLPVVLIYFVATLQPLEYEGKTFPWYIEIWGMILLAIAIVLFPSYWLTRYIQNRKIYGMDKKEVHLQSPTTPKRRYCEITCQRRMNSQNKYAKERYIHRISTSHWNNSLKFAKFANSVPSNTDVVMQTIANKRTIFVDTYGRRLMEDGYLPNASKRIINKYSAFICYRLYRFVVSVNFYWIPAESRYKKTFNSSLKKPLT